MSHEAKSAPQRTPENKTEKRSGGELGLLLLFLSAILVVVAFLWPRASDTLSTSMKVGSLEQNSISTKPPNVRVPPAVVNRINEDLKDTQIKEDMQRQNAEIDAGSAPTLGRIDEDAVRMDQERQTTNPLILDQENTAAKAIQGTQGSGPKLPPTSDQRVNSQMAKEQWTHDYDQKYQEEYVRQFIQNARKSGVDVKLNKDLDVTGLGTHPTDDPIRIPQSVPDADKNAK